MKPCPTSAELDAWRKLLEMAHRSGKAEVASWIADRVMEGRAEWIADKQRKAAGHA